MFSKQVNLDHYDFDNYIDKKRWISIWHQLNEVLILKPESVLEIGPGPGLFKTIIISLGVKIDTVDIDPGLNPDYIASAMDLPIVSNQYDIVCAFQMLEHLPYTESLKAFFEMVRVANKYIIISLPNARFMWRYSFHIPKIGEKVLLIPRPLLWNNKHRFDGEHYWEIGKKGFSINKIIEDFLSVGNVHLNKYYYVDENPYHCFFVFKKVDSLTTD